MWGRYTSSTWGMMERCNSRQRSRQTVVWNFWLGVETLDCGRFRSGKVFGVEGSFGLARSGGGSEMDSESCESLKGRHSGSLDTRHHPDAGQILTLQVS